MAQQAASTEYGNTNMRLASLRHKFLVLFIVLFLAGSAVIYAVTAWFMNDIGGRLGGWLASVFGDDPNRQIREDLQRFKQQMESGAPAGV